MKRLLYIPVLVFFVSCNRIETHDTLSKSDIKYIQSLHLLGKDETIQKFYSEYKLKAAGNFFTDKRIAKYWIDGHDTSKNIVAYAFYNDIMSIDTVYYAGFTYTPFMKITKKDSTQFKVSVEGKRHEVQAFFEDAIRLWKTANANN